MPSSEVAFVPVTDPDTQHNFDQVKLRWPGVGPAGPTGATGPAGPTGATGPAGLQWLGAWAAATAYAINDAVTYNNAVYRRKVAGTTATAPSADATNWELLLTETVPPACSITGAETLTATALGAVAKLAINTVAVNSPAYWNTTSKRYIPLVAGRYAVVGSFAGTTVGSTGAIVDLFIYKNGAVWGHGMRHPSNSAYGPQITVTEQVTMNGSTDYIELWGGHGGAGPGITGVERLSICYLGPN